MKRRFAGAAFAAVGVLFVLVSVIGVREGRADHSTGRDCYDCHDFSYSNVQAGTISVSRTAMAEFRLHGWYPGISGNATSGIGCTFCHRSSIATAAMPDALSGFTDNTPGASRHPVARNFTTGAIENTAYLSNDNTVTAGHLDCRDCHDTTLLTVPNHNANWVANVGNAKTNNPFGLKNVTSPKAYDTLCRNCHGKAGAFTAFTGKAATGTTKLVLASHDNAADNAANALKDIDNTILKPQNEYANNRVCAQCHNSHSSNQGHLYGDGSETNWLGSPVTINENTDCTGVCHMNGDSSNNYTAHGHGKALAWDNSPIARPCTACHDISKPHSPSAAGYEDKYRFPALDNSWKTPSIFGKPVKSVCAQCHGSHPTHNAGRVINGSSEVGCLDCHDQHAKNSDNNVMMIRSSNRVAGSLIGLSGQGAAIGNEAVLFSASEKYPLKGTSYDYYSNLSYKGDTAAGFCDQRACHGAGSNGGVSFTPMSTYLSSGKHSGGNQSVSSDCEGCHKHTDGSFRAISSCTACHGQPPPPADNTAGTVYSRSEVLSPHLTHASTNLSVGYKIDCKMCHVYYVDNNYHNTLPGKTFQSVFFDNSVKRGTSAYDNATFTCTNITCHSDGRYPSPGNPNTAPTWFTGGGGQVKFTSCLDCHNGSTATASPMNTGAHLKHLNSGYSCAACHADTVQSDNVSLNAATGRTKHANGVFDLKFLDNALATYDNVSKNCSGVTCHGGNVVNWVSDIGKIKCANCHAGNGDVDDFGTGSAASMFGNGATSKIDNTEWMYSGHGRDTGTYDCTANVAAALLTGSVGTNKCKFCHDEAVAHGDVTNPYRLANTTWNGLGFDGACYVCHSGVAGKTGTGFQPPADTDNVSKTYALKTAASKVADDHYNWSGSNATNSRHTGSYNGGNFCWDCHDPHGDRSNSTTGNIIMIGKMAHASTDNVYGIPVGGTAGAGRRTVVFTKNANAGDYATEAIDNVAPYNGLCEVCHDAASGVQHYTYQGRLDAVAHNTSKCTGCHGHDDGFKGSGGNNIEQFFDNAYRTDNAANYRDLSGHRILSGTTTSGLYDSAQVNCYNCHGVSGTNRQANECLKCHWENRSSGTPTHPNGTFEWANPASPASQSAAYASGNVDTAGGDAMCLACHGTGGGTALNGVAAPIIIPAGETWNSATASGHGATAKLSADVTVGPANLHCAACHKSSAAQSGGAARDNYPAGFHGSVNRHLIANDNASYATGGAEYPDQTDTYYNTVNLRSARMDNYCATKCHRNTTNGTATDDNVIDHTWNKLGGEVKSGSLSHPSNFLTSASGTTYYKDTTLLPYSDYRSGALPGAGNTVCITCHDAHGGLNTIKNQAGVTQTGGAKNMLRLSPADNVSTLCKECHK